MEWPIVKLGDITEVITKGTTPTSVGFKFIPEGVNFVKVESITSEGRFLPHKFAAISEECNESLKRSQLKEGDVLFSIAGALGRTALVTRDILPANTNQALAIIRLKAELVIDKHFLLLALTTSVTLEQVENSKGGVAQQNLSLGQLKGFEIPLPTISEQKRIVAILEKTFADIKQARTKTEKNLKNARELFESYLQQVFSQSGDGWVERTLEEISKVGSSKRIYETDWTRSGVPFYGGKEIVKLAKHGNVISNAYISEKKYEEYSSKYDMPQKGDILMTARGTIGVSYIVKEGDKFYYKDGNIISLRPKLNINPQFILYAFKSKQILEQLKNLSGTTVNHLPLRKAKELALYIPDLNAQIDTVNKIQKIEVNSHQLIDVYESKLAALDQLKKSILQKAFSGELTKEKEGAVA